MTIYTLKMDQFLRILFQEEEQPAWWEDLYADYLSQRENQESQYVLGLLKDIASLHNQFIILSKIAEILPHFCSDVFITELRQAGISGAFNPDYPEQYQQDCRAAKSQIKRIKSQIRLKEKELDDYRNSFKGEQMSRKTFEEYATIYSKFMGDMIDFEKISVARWCSIANKYDTHVEVMNAQIESQQLKAGGYNYG